MDIFWRKLISWSPLRRKGLTGSFEKRAPGPEGFGGTLLALPFVPLSPGLLRQIRKQMVFL